MKAFSLSNASLIILYLASFAYAAVENEDERLQSLMTDPKFKINNLGNVIPGRFIIEFDEGYQGSSLEFVSDIEKDISMTVPNISSRIKMSIAQDYNSKSAIFRGISISLHEVPEDGISKRDSGTESTKEEKSLHMQAYQNTVLKKILQQHRVKHVYPVTEFERPKVEYLSNMNVYEFQNDNMISKTPNITLAKDGEQLPFTHPMAQVDRVTNNMKLKGKGVLVGIIDSGIDYRHPAFGGGFGPGYQVRFGMDLVGSTFNSRDPLSRRQRDSPLDDCSEGNGHGTHVAGIIAANDKMFNFSGVAPEVTLGAWRVFGCNGATSNDLVIKALIEAHEAGCDVINLSLGSSSNWAQDPTAVIANRVSEKGSIVIAAAGNDGSEGAFYISSPGTGSSTIAAASVDNDYNLQQTVISKEGGEYAYLLSSSTKFFPSGKLVGYSNNEAVAADACNDAVPQNDLTGKIVLVQRGKCTFDEKAALAEKYGAVGILIYDNEPGSGFKAQSLKSKIPMASITQDAGLELKKLLDTKYKDGIQMDFDESLTRQAVPTAQMISKFSSVGPLYDMGMKPDFAGPGGYIFSTLPIANGGYGMLSGTSMAAPFIAGAYALFLEAHGKDKDANYLKEHFQNYAKPVMQGSSIDNPIRQGAGLLQVYDTINQLVHVSPGHLSFNDTANIKPQKLTISNPGNDTITYAIIHKPSVAVIPYNTSLQGYAPLQPARYSSTKIEATIELSKEYITLNPGETQDLDLNVIGVTDTGLDKQYPMYGGYIEFSPVNNSIAKSINVPYIGVKGSLAELPIFAATYPRLLVTNSSTLFEAKKADGNSTIGLVIDRSDRDAYSVTCVFRLLTGTAQSITEVLDVDLKKIGTYSQEGYVARNTMSDVDYVFAQRWNGSVVLNGSDSYEDLVNLPQGFYHLKWKALKLMSEPQNEDSWESRLSPPIFIRD